MTRKVTKLTSKEVQHLVSLRISVLGDGGQGVVYLVPWQDEPAVLKVGISESSSKYTHFKQEAKLMSEADGAGGVPILLAVAPHTPAIVCSFSGKKTLAYHMFNNKKKYNLLELGVLAGKQLLQLHKKGIIHNDIKPDNIMVNGGRVAPQVNLIDLGQACKAGESLNWDRDPNRSLWRAPEVCRGQPSTPESDVFSFGVLMKNLLGEVSGDHPNTTFVTKTAFNNDPSQRPSLKNFLRQLFYAIQEDAASSRQPC
ncbi:casein kinase 1-like protein 4 [Homarus americanus]|uniref:casein kinase 1-like protein 4 n=1 Tax=Homarus americanus TaxID=6706 RepID=UPI001C4744B4|nr:casein kinase 1-like protein 4 [Homarus americanus]